MIKKIDDAEPIRILQVFSRMDRGGSETAIMNVYRNIDKEKVQFDFIVHTNEKCSYDDEIKKLGGKIYRMPRYSIKNHKEYKKKWWFFLKEHPEYKIIHGHFFTISSIYFSVAKKQNLLCIAHSHSEFRGSLIKQIKIFLMTFMLRFKSDYLFACSEAAGQSLYGRRVIIKDKFYIVNNAIETEKFIYNNKIRKKIRKELKINNEFVVGHVGRFNRVKNHELIIDIFKDIYSKNKNTKLLLVGEGELYKDIELRVKECNLSEQVIFTGVRSDVPNLLQAMDVFLMPSHFEGLPVTLVEAQASGIQSVISDNITDEVKITDLVESISLKQSPSYWAERIIKYSVGYQRRDMSEEIRNAGYDVKTTAKWLENFYLKEYSKHQMNN